MAMTLQQAEQILGPRAAAQIRRKLARKTAPAAGSAAAAPPSAPAANSVARGQKKPGEMNSLERAYEAEVLKPALQAGEILWYAYESVKLKLAPKTHLTVDFFVMTKAGELEAHETKGFMREDANVKLKVAAAAFPFRFLLIKQRAKKAGGGFTVQKVGA